MLYGYRSIIHNTWGIKGVGHLFLISRFRALDVGWLEIIRGYSMEKDDWVTIIILRYCRQQVVWHPFGNCDNLSTTNLKPQESVKLLLPSTIFILHFGDKNILKPWY